MNKLIPQNKTDDPLFNRRLMTYYGCVFSAAWMLMVFVVDAVRDTPFETAKVIAYLGVPTTLLGIFGTYYLRACEQDDKARKQDD